MGQQPHVERPFPCLVGLRLGPPGPWQGSGLGTEDRGGYVDSHLEQGQRLGLSGPWCVGAEKWVVGLCLYLEL